MTTFDPNKRYKTTELAVKLIKILAKAYFKETTIIDRAWADAVFEKEILPTIASDKFEYTDFDTEQCQYLLDHGLIEEVKE